MVPLNIYSSFTTRRKVISILILISGIYIGGVIFLQEINTPQRCSLDPQMVFCSTYNYLVEGIVYPFIFIVAGSVISLLNYISLSFSRYLDIAQRFVFSIFSPLIFIVFPGYVFLIPFKIIFILLLGPWIIFMIRYRLHPVEIPNLNAFLKNSKLQKGKRQGRLELN